MVQKEYKIPFHKPFVTDKSKEYINFLFENNLPLDGGGYFSKKCQEYLEDKYKVNKVLLTTSCTSALEIAMMLADIKNGDEVIMPSYTFVSTANSVILRGGIPVFVDICATDFNIDYAQVSRAISLKTKAVVPVHYGGNSCNMDKILQIAKDKKLFVIEDAAQAINAYYKNKALGTLGDIGAISFHSTKNIQAGECGAVYVNNKLLSDRVDHIIEKGTNRKKYLNGEIDKYTWVDIGSSYYPNDLTAAYLYAQLNSVDTVTKARINIWNRYHEFLQKYEDKGYMRLPHPTEYAKGNAHNYFVLMNSNQDRNKFLCYLKDNYILAQTHFIPLHNSPFGKLHAKTVGSMDVTNMVYECSLRLPLYIMKNEEIQYIMEIIKKYFG